MSTSQDTTNNYRFSTMKSKENLEMGKSIRMSTTSMVSINQIPILNIFDMRKASSNMQLVRMGNVNKPEDLES